LLLSSFRERLPLNGAAVLANDHIERHRFWESMLVYIERAWIHNGSVACCDYCARRLLCHLQRYSCCTIHDVPIHTARPTVAEPLCFGHIPLILDLSTADCANMFTRRHTSLQEALTHSLLAPSLKTPGILVARKPSRSHSELLISSVDAVP
jgi:hypothetical protein